MISFKEFITSLLDLSRNNPILLIKGIKKSIIGMSRYTTRNMPGSEYIKIVFDDHSLLLILISDQEIYYADSALGKVDQIHDEMIGAEKLIEYRGKQYQLVNKNDYQYVMQKYLGGIDDIEGECSFSDYVPVDGNKAMLSLGVITATGSRADVYCELIDLSQISIAD